MTAGNVDVVGETVVTGTVGRVHVATSELLILLGVAQGGVVVSHGGHARVVGRCEGLFVAVGGYAELTGTCHGAAVNDGGCLHLAGTVEGPLVDYAGETVVEPDSVITEGTIHTMPHRA